MTTGRTDVSTSLLHWPPLSGLSAEQLGHIVDQTRSFEAPAGTLMFDAGRSCEGLPLITRGSIRVVKRGDNGREISLYRVQPGELCIVTLSCLLGGDAYPATGIAEQSVTGHVLPRTLFMSLLETHPPFRHAAFSLFAERLSSLMQLVEEVSFRKLDQRLATLLAKRAPLLRGSHQQLADELGSVREIVTRLLKQFAERGWVQLGRERIEVLDPVSLRAWGSGQAQ